MTDFEKEVGQAEWKAKQKNEKYIGKLRKYIEKMIDIDGRCKSNILYMVENDIKSIYYGTVYNIQYDCIPKWIFHDIILFEKSLNNIIEDQNKKLKEKFNNKVRIIYQLDHLDDYRIAQREAHISLKLI